ncbi:MAG: hypothetical protein ACR2L8_07605 [Solirubrobacteraceae bacterium]
MTLALPVTARLLGSVGEPSAHDSRPRGVLLPHTSPAGPDRQKSRSPRGPGGLRTIPVLLDMCRDIEELCPDALLLQYVNPMAMPAGPSPSGAPRAGAGRGGPRAGGQPRPL